MRTTRKIHSWIFLLELNSLTNKGHHFLPKHVLSAGFCILCTLPEGGVEDALAGCLTHCTDRRALITQRSLWGAFSLCAWDAIICSSQNWSFGASETTLANFNTSNMTNVAFSDGISNCKCFFSWQVVGVFFCLLSFYELNSGTAVDIWFRCSTDLPSMVPFLTAHIHKLSFNCTVFIQPDAQLV